MAILKVCGGKIEKMREFIKYAKIDSPRDVLWSAEEPNIDAVEDMSKLTEDEIRELQKKDREQYVRWLYSEDK